MAKPKIGYQNLLESAVSITVTDEDAGFEKELAYNWRTHDGWRPQSSGTVYYTVDMGTAQNVDYWGLAAHTLGTNTGTIKLQSSATGAFGGEEVDFDTALAPTTNETLFQTVTTPVSARYWRFEVISTPPSILGALSFGASLEFARAVDTGFILPRESRMNKIINNRTEGGAFVGKSLIRKGVQSNIRLTLQDLSYARGAWSTFIDHAELKPFFFSWNPDFDDAVYLWMEGDPIPVSYDRLNTVTMGIKVKGIV